MDFIGLRDIAAAVSGRRIGLQDSIQFSTEDRTAIRAALARVEGKAGAAAVEIFITAITEPLAVAALEAVRRPYRAAATGLPFTPAADLKRLKRILGRLDAARADVDGAGPWGFAALAGGAFDALNQARAAVRLAAESLESADRPANIDGRAALEHSRRRRFVLAVSLAYRASLGRLPAATDPRSSGRPGSDLIQVLNIIGPSVDLAGPWGRDVSAAVAVIRKHRLDRLPTARVGRVPIDRQAEVFGDLSKT